eukprot:3688006-Prymnesium_polylepis.1
MSSSRMSSRKRKTKFGRAAKTAVWARATQASTARAIKPGSYLEDGESQEASAEEATGKQKSTKPRQANERNWRGKCDMVL